MKTIRSRVVISVFSSLLIIGVVYTMVAVPLGRDPLHVFASPNRPPPPDRLPPPSRVRSKGAREPTRSFRRTKATSPGDPSSKPLVSGESRATVLLR